ncbi:MAG: hypothetical protein KGJ43_07440, partial [Acidobacteriota bacterium]|nr:hypothetical protein [Acidobacteriota bacterium]
APAAPRAAGPERAPLELLPLAAGLAVCDIAGADARLKWPNDVVFERSPGVLTKLAGVLVEGRPQAGWVVLGIGVNVAVPEAAVPAELRGSLASLGRDAAAIEGLLDRLLAALELRLREPPQRTISSWSQLDVLRGRDVEWSAGDGAGGGRAIAGRAEGVDGGGHLIVRGTDGERVALRAAEVRLA